ncbi:DNA invertase Pin-like site-specific DNA recombinase [Pontibacter ummariensis]|uniref:Site-specific DNA recombinase n=1 Tax=Pontibacter ummariensis TaxID=1610492 RepID=A0A239J579_9BACT|nr:recombinase family protein [Pontibacter ummariensis]PRY08865.1 DNA invertase Pin-like site-specific DNA recombinase [Pontibacter ummariensis]SNT00403.1 Site-specific DNA recombinase [Pontibacter ummariensis]
MKEKDLFTNKRQKKNSQKKETNNVVIYTRVSTKEQYETNASLGTQKKVCEEFAKKNGYNVVKSFGDTYESAKTDKGRKHFQAMLDYIKKHKKDIRGVIVYDYSRFSRSEENVVLVYELKRLGVEVLSATQHIDTKSSTGKFAQALQLILANLDNEQKSERTKAGIIEKLKQGIWPTKLPVGYAKNQETKSVEITKEGELIKEAFILIASGDTITSIKKKMDRKGFRRDIRRWGDILDNPFYCGLIVHRLLDYQPIKGVHPPLISVEQWEKIKRARAGKEIVQSYINAAPFYPLKGFISCACGRKFTGYQAKKKAKPNGNFFYYKCNNSSCYTNVSTKVAEQEFATFLSKLSLNKNLQGVFKKQLKATYLNYKNESRLKKKKLEADIKDYENKSRLLTDKWLYEGLDKEIYQEHKLMLEEGKAAAVQEHNLLELELSNPDEFINFAVYISANLHRLWEKAEVGVKKRLQELVFPQGVSFVKETKSYRTPEINIIFKLNGSKPENRGHKKSGEISNSANSPASVPWAVVLLYSAS